MCVCVCVCVDGKLVEFSALLALCQARDGWRRDRCSLQKQVLMAAHADKLEITIFDGCLTKYQARLHAAFREIYFITRRVSREKCVHARRMHTCVRRWLHLWSVLRCFWLLAVATVGCVRCRSPHG